MGTHANDRPSLRVAAARLGFLADSYDLFAIDSVLLILKYEYGDLLGASAESLIVSAMLVGVVVGQLSFGFIADSFGRKWAFVTTAGLTVVGALASAACWDDQGGSGHSSLAKQLAACRFLLGIGVGGEYPLSASVTAESGAGDKRFLLASVVAMQGFGMLLASCVTLAALQSQLSLEASWRLALAFGAVPSLVAFALRWQLHESPEFQRAQAEGGHADATKGSLPGMLSSLWRPLVGTAIPWLVMNAVLYSLGSFKSLIFDDLFPLAADSTPREQVFSAAVFAAICSAFAIAGFATALMLLRFRIDLASLQLGGFLALAVIFVFASVLNGLPSVPPSMMLLCLGLMFFFQNCGPNTTTYVVAAEAYPTLVRATCHGISAASGKVGGVIGTASFGPLRETAGMHAVYAICACLSLAGALVTFGFTPRSSALAKPTTETEDEDASSHKVQNYRTFGVAAAALSRSAAC